MRTRRSNVSLPLLAAALTIVVAACAPADSAESADEMPGIDHGQESGDTGTADADRGELGHEEAAPAPVAGAQEIAVSASSFAFEPGALTVTAGEPVNLALTSADILHDLVVEDEGFHLSAEADETSTGALLIDEPGTYTVYCSVPGHRQAGMEATLEVEEA